MIIFLVDFETYDKTLIERLNSEIQFFIVYLLMAKEIWARSDAWLTGEAQVLAEVAEGRHEQVLG